MSEEGDSETTQLCRSSKPHRKLAAGPRCRGMEDDCFQDAEPGTHAEAVKGRWGRFWKVREAWKPLARTGLVTQREGGGRGDRGWSARVAIPGGLRGEAWGRGSTDFRPKTEGAFILHKIANVRLVPCLYYLTEGFKGRCPVPMFSGSNSLHS